MQIWFPQNLNTYYGQYLGNWEVCVTNWHTIVNYSSNYSILVYLPHINIAVYNLSCLCLPGQAEEGEENVVESVTELPGGI